MSMFPASAALTSLRMGAIGTVSPLCRPPSCGASSPEPAQLLPDFGTSSAHNSPQRSAADAAGPENPLLAGRSFPRRSEARQSTQLPSVDASLAADSTLIYPDDPSAAFNKAELPLRSPQKYLLLRSPVNSHIVGVDGRGSPHTAPQPAPGSPAQRDPRAASRLNPLLGLQRAVTMPAAVTTKLAGAPPERSEPLTSPLGDNVYFYTTTGSGPARLHAGSPQRSRSPITILPQPIGRYTAAQLHASEALRQVRP